MDKSIFDNTSRLEKFKQIIRKYEINRDYAFRLRALEGFEIILIADDSWSMRTPVIDTNQSEISPFDELPKRWDELKLMASIVVDLVGTLDPNGMDVYFLNREPLLRVTDSSQLNETFSKLPSGPTPITSVLSNVLNFKRSDIYDRKLLILIATDGIPTNKNGENDLDGLEKVLRNERYPAIDRMHITFIACTNDLQSVGFLNGFDKKIPYVDVLDDYRSERAEVIAAQGGNFRFSYGDYVVKLLVGSIDPWFDKLDENKVKLTNQEKFRRKTFEKYYFTKKQSCIIS